MELGEGVILGLEQLPELGAWGHGDEHDGLNGPLGHLGGGGGGAVGGPVRVWPQGPVSLSPVSLRP